MTSIAFANNGLGLRETEVIDRAIYFDPDVFRLEMDRIFKRTWQFVGHESELVKAGDYLATEIADQPVIVTRGKDGGLNAFYNNCTHRGAALTMERKGNCRNAFRCMYHGWSFDLQGRLTGVPRPSNYGADFDKSRFDIPKIRVESFEGFVFVNLDPAAEPLLDYLGDIAPIIAETSGDCEVIGRVSCLYEGNWKLWPENFRDGYHPEYTHPLVGAYYREVAVSSGTIEAFNDGHSKLWWPFEGNPANIGMQKAQLLGEREQGFDSPATRARPPVEPDYRKGNSILAVFPNLDIQSLMGGAEHVLQVVRPIDPNRTRLDLCVLAPRGESPEARQWRKEKSMDAQGTSGKVSGDDAEACARISYAVRADAVRWTPLTRGPADGPRGQKTEDHALRGYYAAWRRYMGDVA